MERFRVPGGALDLVGGGAALLDDLPPGFRFHPTDEELVSFYLLRKALDAGFRGRAIAEVDLNRCEPWELPARAADAGTEGEWYFFSLRDRKYPTGLRTNRATRAGYWKATGKDREVRSSAGAAVVGMKKTLVFYRGRAPKGQKTTWVMHEYRLEGTYAYNNFPGSTRDEWVLVRVFQKPVPGEAPSARRNNRLVGLGSAASCCFSDSTSASVGGGGGGASASSAPRQLLLTDSSLFAAADGETGGGSYAGGGCYGGANNNADASNNNSIVPCFSTTAAAAPMISSSMDAATLGIGQYSPAPLAIEPPPAAFFASSLRSLQDNGSSVHQLPLLLSSGTASPSSALGGGGHHFWGPANVKIEGGIGHVAAQPQMAVGPGQLDGAYAWGF